MRCLGAAPLLLAFPAEAVLGGVTPAPDMLQLFAEGATAAGQGSASGAARPRQPGSDRARTGRRVSLVAEEMGRLKVPVSVSGTPRREQLSALRDALTEGPVPA